MPRTMHPELEEMHFRANPATDWVAEISAPDVQHVVRSGPDFTTNSPPKVSITPANSVVSSPIGPLVLASVGEQLASLYANDAGGLFSLNKEDPARRLKSVRWLVDRQFQRATLRQVKVRVKRFAVLSTFFPSDFDLQIYRAVGQAGVLVKQQGTNRIETPFIEWRHVPLLPEPVLIKAAAITWSGGNEADLVFSLTPYALVVEHKDIPAPSVTQTGEQQAYFFVVRALKPPVNDAFEWRIDTTSARTVAGVGTFQRHFWVRDNPNDPRVPWSEQVFNDAPNVQVDVERYEPTSTAVYALDLKRVPVAGATGRTVFERGVPSGTSATLELSTAGSGGPWAAVKHGDVVALAQQAYHLRLVMNASADRRSTPAVHAIGVEFRTVHDVTFEAVIEHPGHEVDVPFCRAAIPSGGVKVLRTGVRDYGDTATELGSTKPAPRLECDISLGSRHPAVGRDKWLLVERAMVSTRQPTPTAERFSLLSYAQRLKRKIPARVESINTVHKVAAGTTASAVKVVTPPILTGTTSTGNEYDGKGYYVRVRKAADPTREGYIQVINGNTGVDQLDFTPTSLPYVLAAGDEVEVHSGQFRQPALSWINADPADVWFELFTVHGAIPPERVGDARFPRSGFPPKVTDRAPGDELTQRKLRVSARFEEAESVDELIDQVSFLIGGVTVEIGGQFVYRQIYASRSPTGAVVIPPEPVAATFDLRDYANLETPVGLEERITVLAADYGVNPNAADPDAETPDTTVFADADAIAWLTAQELEELGDSEIPEEIARWCYNAEDDGLHLATLAAQQVVLACSTGKRLWPWTSVEARPDLVVGDRVVVITDQYTDYDPALKHAIKGWWAFTLVLVGASGGGRQFRGFMVGLTGSAEQLAGGLGSLVRPASIAIPIVGNPCGEATALGGGPGRQGMAWLPVQFTPNLASVEVSTYKSERKGAPMPVLASNQDSWTLRRQEGEIASKPDWPTYLFRAAPAGWWVTFVLVGVDFQNRRTAPIVREVLCVDTGVPPSGPPTNVTKRIAGDAVELEGTMTDLAANLLVMRNGFVLLELTPNNYIDGKFFVTDRKVDTGVPYTYWLVAKQNCQTAAPVVVTLGSISGQVRAPAWRDGYPLPVTVNGVAKARVGWTAHADTTRLLFQVLVGVDVGSGDEFATLVQIVPLVLTGEQDMEGFSAGSTLMGRFKAEFADGTSAFSAPRLTTFGVVTNPPPVWESGHPRGILSGQARFAWKTPLAPNTSATRATRLDVEIEEPVGSGTWVSLYNTLVAATIQSGFHNDNTKPNGTVRDARLKATYPEGPVYSDVRSAKWGL